MGTPDFQNLLPREESSTRSDRRDVFAFFATFLGNPFFSREKAQNAQKADGVAGTARAESLC
jgi:hypothetical protein